MIRNAARRTDLGWRANRGSVMTEEQNDPEATWTTARLNLLGLFTDFTASPEAALNEGLKQQLYLAIVDVCKVARAWVAVKPQEENNE